MESTMTTTILTNGRVTWTNITQTTPKDLEQLGTKYPQFHALHLHDCVTDLEFPKLDHEDHYLFIVIHIPWQDPEERIYHATEVDLFIASGTLVTSHEGCLQPLTEMFERAQSDSEVREQLMGQGASPLLYELLKRLVDSCYPSVYEVNQRIRHIEKNLFSNDTPHILREIAEARRDVIALRHILQPQLETVRQLEQGDWPFVHGELDHYWGDIGDHLAQLQARLEEHNEVLSILSDTIDTLASHRIDEVVRLLTVITLLTVPLTVLSTVFGMNVQLPYGSYPLPFYLINIVGIVLTILVIWYLRRRKWL
jgi:magnesium transporter